MLPDFMGLNWWAVVVAGLAVCVLAGLWYGPLFGRAWRDVAGVSGALGSTPWVVAVITALVVSATLAGLIAMFGVDTFAEGAAFGALTGCGLIAASMAGDAAFCRTDVRQFAIQAGYRIVAAALAGGILGLWPRV